MSDGPPNILRPVARESLNLLMRPASSLRFRRVVTESAGPLAIVIGAGPKVIPGWINTDRSWRARYYLDLMRPWPVPKGSVGLVYGDNVVEHFPLVAVRRVLGHIHDALEPGGWLRLATPDVERIARAYLDGPEDVRATLMGNDMASGPIARYPVDLLRVCFAESGHHLGYCFDFASLSAELEAVGFTEVRRCEVGESDVARLRDLESRTDASDRFDQLVVEARKPL